MIAFDVILARNRFSDAYYGLFGKVKAKGTFTCIQCSYLTFLFTEPKGFEDNPHPIFTSPALSAGWSVFICN
ncbi:MAG: hypothetical protein IPO92_18515 [Saprospiraceae bacterium]|nr:hypothetical protein [Saprospiraceae bacterium]